MSRLTRAITIAAIVSASALIQAMPSDLYPMLPQLEPNLSNIAYPETLLFKRSGNIQAYMLNQCAVSRAITSCEVYMQDSTDGNKHVHGYYILRFTDDQASFDQVADWFIEAPPTEYDKGVDAWISGMKFVKIGSVENNPDWAPPANDWDKYYKGIFGTGYQWNY